MKIRDVTHEDKAALISLCQITELFQPNELEELSSMLSAYFEDGLDGEHKWLTDEEDGQLRGVAYYAEETFANGVSNLLLIAVHPEYQRKGRGTEFLRHVEAELRRMGKRILIIETSSLDSFEATRAFYRKNGYDEEARIREYYNPGEDKIVFRKVLL
ncbi:GNAT family N-acetyltransferase [Waterburya agarophytonicola K14]|uniref:GNAT family N-acetyltransferase n=2 Tax=Waterburya TaxID=2886915 RepID=A0A964BMC5_9CYAN|nr:GNAT family N-acetyltransferase [Waterburya agarophytonicola KI4]